MNICKNDWSEHLPYYPIFWCGAWAMEGSEFRSRTSFCHATLLRLIPILKQKIKREEGKIIFPISLFSFFLSL